MDDGKFRAVQHAEHSVKFYERMIEQGLERIANQQANVLTMLDRLEAAHDVLDRATAAFTKEPSDG